MNQDSVSKLTATQNVIKNKFEKAYTNRLVNEHDVNHVMKPLTASPSSSTSSSSSTSTVDLESKNSDFSIHNLSKTTTNNSPQLHLATKSDSNHAIKLNEEKHQHDPNTLCAILRILLASSPNDGDIRCTQQIKSILDELRELEIII